jgi:aspartate ammonia-lyase
LNTPHPVLPTTTNPRIPDAATSDEVRIESDSLGTREIPAEVYWGVHTSRAVENFPIAKRPISVYPELIVAFAGVKQAAARANAELGTLEKHKADLIDRACQEIIDGKLHDQFVVGVMQGGAGTSTNMNVNEVVANRALDNMGLARGRFDVIHPNNDVNLS